MKNKRIKITCCIILLIFIIISCFSSDVSAADMKDIYNVNLSNVQIGNKNAGSVVGEVLGIVQAVGYVAAVIVLTIMGIKFIWTSPEGKAELKKQFIPYFIGVFILIGGGTLAGVIANVAYNNI